MYEYVYGGEATVHIVNGRTANTSTGLIIALHFGAAVCSVCVCINYMQFYLRELILNSWSAQPISGVCTLTGCLAGSIISMQIKPYFMFAVHIILWHYTKIYIQYTYYILYLYMNLYVERISKNDRLCLS